MARFQIKTFRQVAGSPLLAHPDTAIEFDADSAEAARCIADTRLAALSPSFIAILFDHEDMPIWTWDPKDA